MIKHVEIKGFQSCVDTSCDLAPLTVLLGRNGAGKTTLLTGIQRIASFATTVGFRPFDATMEFSLDDIKYQYQLNSWYAPAHDRTATRERNEALSIIDGPNLLQRDLATTWIGGSSSKRERIGAISPSTPALYAAASLLPNNETVRVHVQRVLRFMEAIHYYPVDEPHVQSAFAIITDQVYQSWLGGDQAAFPSDPVLLALIHMSQQRKEQFDELVSLAGPQGLGIVDDIHVERLATGESVQYIPYFMIAAKLMPFNALSFGTRRLVKLLTHLVYDESSVMLLEHPENGIHGALLDKLMGILDSFSDRSQFIISSHSCDVLDHVSPNDVRLVFRGDEGTKVRALSNKELSAARNYINREGALSDFLQMVEDD